jgi:hypothetical protein
MPHPKLSRRELLRRCEQGREAMRCLASAAIAAGGTLRVPRDTYRSLDPAFKMNVLVEDFTGDLLITIPGFQKPVMQEVTFEELQKRLKDEAPKQGGQDSVRDDSEV